MGTDNTGNRNTGNRNTGNRNTGNRNTGDWNTGDWNTGDWNTGNWNTGHWNTGHCNTGNWNTGNRNTGDWNTGAWNTGDWNTGNWNTGFFCTETHAVSFFDIPTHLTREQAIDLIPHVELPVGAIWTPSDKMTAAEKAANPNHATIGGYLRSSGLAIQDAFPLAWAKMNEATRQRFLNLPNFDAEKFLKCTGVAVRIAQGKRVRIRTDDGKEVIGSLIEE